MPFTKTHASIRSAVSQQILNLTAELAALAAPAERLLSLGTISDGDGGATSTGELKTPVDVLQEILDTTAGDPNFSVNMTRRDSNAPPIVRVVSNTGVGSSQANFSIIINNLLPKPRVVLHRGTGLSLLDISARCALAGNTYNPSVNAPPDQSAYATLVVNLSGVQVAAFPNTGGVFKIVITNPLDVGASSFDVILSIFTI